MFADLPPLVLIGWFLLVATCFTAWRWGGKAERHGTILVLVITVGFAVAGALPNKDLVRALYLALDGVLALGLLLLALKHATTWLGVAVLSQGVQFSLHAYYLVADKRYDRFYAMVNNLVTLTVLCCLLVGAFLRRRKVAK